MDTRIQEVLLFKICTWSKKLKEVYLSLEHSQCSSPIIVRYMPFCMSCPAMCRRNEKLIVQECGELNVMCRYGSCSKVPDFE